jgi:hypothetical protein
MPPAENSPIANPNQRNCVDMGAQLPPAVELVEQDVAGEEADKTGSAVVVGKLPSATVELGGRKPQESRGLHQDHSRVLAWASWDHILEGSAFAFLPQGWYHSNAMV